MTDIALPTSDGTKPAKRSRPPSQMAEKATFLVSGAKCGGCLSKIENTLASLDEVEASRMNLSTGRLSVTWTSPETDPEIVVSALDKIGFPARPFDPRTSETERTKREKHLLSCLGVAGFAAANVMLLSVSVWAGSGEMDMSTRTMLHWISGAIAIPAVGYAGRPFFNSALTALRSGHVNMDVPISLAVILATGLSIYETLNHGEHAYFDASVMLLFFLLIGRFLDARLQRQAHSAAEDLAAMQTVSVRRKTPDGRYVSAQAADLSPGDVIHLSSGERLPVDASLQSGDAQLDVSLVTGESRPVEARRGARLYAGSVNIGAAVEVQVRSGLDDSLLTEISALLDAGEQKRSRYRQIADKAASLYVPIVHTLAAAAFLGWLFATGDVRLALFTAISVLVITCPCALALAAPVVQVVAVGRLFRDGVYLKSGDALERIAETDHVIFDKTGTLTCNRPVLLRTEAIDRVLDDAALLARASRHPFSQAIAFAAGDGALAERVEEIAGKGVEARVGGRTARLGQKSFVGQIADLPDQSVGSGVWFGIEGDTAVEFTFEERLLPGHDQLAAEITALDMTAELLSGDSGPRVAQVASEIGFDHHRGDTTPTDKADRVEALSGNGHKVLMVGDGLNDAGAIASAHASLTPGGALHITQSASDGIYAADAVGLVPAIIRLARTAKRRTQENFGLAVIYNMIAVPIALAGFVTPLIAAIAMSASSVVVTLNALRIPALRSRT